MAIGTPDRSKTLLRRLLSSQRRATGYGRKSRADAGRFKYDPDMLGLELPPPEEPIIPTKPQGNFNLDEMQGDRVGPGDALSPSSGDLGKTAGDAPAPEGEGVGIGALAPLATQFGISVALNAMGIPLPPTTPLALLKTVYNAVSGDEGESGQQGISGPTSTQGSGFGDVSPGPEGSLTGTGPTPGPVSPGPKGSRTDTAPYGGGGGGNFGGGNLISEEGQMVSEFGSTPITQDAPVIGPVNINQDPNVYQDQLISSPGAPGTGGSPGNAGHSGASQGSPLGGGGQEGDTGNIGEGDAGDGDGK